MFSESYFNNKELNTLTNSCFDSGGMPAVEVGTLNKVLSFECK
ncbi:hypothetical protein [Priestia flexa]|nr:hypothetical protein [Priestia flexa]UZW66586.1 hypothetical protein OC195_00970 [Priestia flexa]